MSRVLGVAAIFALSLSACDTNTVARTDFETGTLSWDWSQGSGDIPRYFLVECKTSAGDAVKPLRVDDVATRSIPVKDMVPGPGSYSCVIRAVNNAGRSLPSKEVRFVVTGSDAGRS